jgi:hypothetical protein
MQTDSRSIIALNLILLNWLGSGEFYPVTAPSDAEETELAYFAITPRV